MIQKERKPSLYLSKAIHQLNGIQSNILTQSQSMKPCFKYKADYTVKSHVKCFSHKSAAPISMLFWGKNVLTSVTQA